MKDGDKGVEGLLGQVGIKPDDINRQIKNLQKFLADTLARFESAVPEQFKGAFQNVLRTMQNVNVDINAILPFLVPILTLAFLPFMLPTRGEPTTKPGGTTQVTQPGEVITETSLVTKDVNAPVKDNTNDLNVPDPSIPEPPVFIEKNLGPRDLPTNNSTNEAEFDIETGSIVECVVTLEDPTPENTPSKTAPQPARPNAVPQVAPVQSIPAATGPKVETGGKVETRFIDRVLKLFN